MKSIRDTAILYIIQAVIGTSEESHDVSIV